MSNVREFLRALRQSGLVPVDQIEPLLETAQVFLPPESLEPSASVRGLAEYFIRSGILTRWQAKQLAQGCSRGFFLGRFRLMGLLGRGGMSVVYRALSADHPEGVALKVLTPDRQRRSSLLERFRLEADALCRLRHPNVVRAWSLEYGRQGGSGDISVTGRYEGCKSPKNSSDSLRGSEVLGQSGPETAGFSWTPDSSEITEGAETARKQRPASTQTTIVATELGDSLAHLEWVTDLFQDSVSDSTPDTRESDGFPFPPTTDTVPDEQEPEDTPRKNDSHEHHEQKCIGFKSTVLNVTARNNDIHSLTNNPLLPGEDDDSGDGYWFMVMKYIRGRNLATIVRDEGPLPIREAAEYLRQATEGLAAIHAAGYVHRDIKPGNFMIEPDGQVRILDLGLARFGDETPDGLTPRYADRLFGTADYLSPEQVHNSHIAGVESDIYSLGATFYTMLTGYPPFRADLVAEKLEHHLHTPAPDLRTLRPETPAALAMLTRRMLAKKPYQRPRSAKEITKSLTAFLKKTELTCATMMPETLPQTSLGPAPLRKTTRIPATVEIPYALTIPVAEPMGEDFLNAGTSSETAMNMKATHPSSTDSCTSETSDIYPEPSAKNALRLSEEQIAEMLDAPLLHRHPEPLEETLLEEDPEETLRAIEQIAERFGSESNLVSLYDVPEHSGMDDAPRVDDAENDNSWLQNTELGSLEEEVPELFRRIGLDDHEF